MARSPNGQAKEFVGFKIGKRERKELQRRASRGDYTLSGYISMVLEAHLDGRTACIACGFTHEILHHIANPTSNRGNGR